MLRCLALFTLIFGLAGCGDGGIRKRVFPPTASIQEVAVQRDGRWALKLRLQNFSNVSMRIGSIDAELTLGDASAGRIVLQPDVDVPPESVEILELEILPQSAAANPVQNALARRGSVDYTLEGVIVSSQPQKRRDDFLFESQLSAVPGLTGVLR